MSRGFLVGLFWGTLASLVGLGVISLVLPPLDPAGAPAVAKIVSPAPQAAQAPQAELAAAEPTVPPAPEAVAAQAPEPEPEAAPEPAPVTATMAEPEPEPAPAPQPGVAPAEPREFAMETGSGAAPEAPAAELAPRVPAATPAEPETVLADAAPAPPEGTMPAPRQDRLLEPPVAPAAPSAEALPSVPAAEAAAPQTGPAETLQEAPPVPPAPAPEAEVLPDPVAEVPAPEAAPGPESPPTVPPEGAPAEPVAEAPAGAAIVRDMPGQGASRLPGLGAADQPGAGAPAPAADADLAEAESPEAAPEAMAEPIIAHARPFVAEPDRPRFAVILQDIGSAGLPREDLALLPFAVTFAVDPTAPDAAEALRAYRAAGQEVVILSGALPVGATASDLEQIFQTYSLNLPETVALLDAPEGGLQEDRPLATQAIPILKSQGRGIITFDRGLGAAEQVAARAGLAHAAIFRSLDAAGESAETIRRFLDRAAFKAAQEGQVVVFGQTRPETVAALMEWIVEGRGASVQLAPVTAVMTAE